MNTKNNVESWEEALIVEVMEEYVSTIENTHGMEYGEKVTKRRACFDKLKDFIRNLLLTQSKAQEDTIKSLRAVIRSMDRELKDYDAIALYDIYAMAFYYDTGIWPAGKSAPMEMHHEFDHAERSKKYTEWLQALTNPTIKSNPSE
jgi:hypothetical protein